MKKIIAIPIWRNLNKVMQFMVQYKGNILQFNGLPPT